MARQPPTAASIESFTRQTEAQHALNLLQQIRLTLSSNQLRQPQIVLSNYLKQTQLLTNIHHNAFVYVFFRLNQENWKPKITLKLAKKFLIICAYLRRNGFVKFIEHFFSITIPRKNTKGFRLENRC